MKLLPVTFIIVSLLFSTSNNNDIVGNIFHSTSGNRISYTELIENMKNVDVIYLGEKHDNIEHHQYQIDIINSLVNEGLNPIIGFEFFYQHQTSDLIKYTKGIKSPFQHGKIDPEKEESKIREKLGWQKREDEDWQFYFSFINLAKEKQLDVFGADLHSGIVSRISRGGLDSLNPIEKNELSPTNFNNSNYKSLMVQKFIDSHCGWVPEDNFEKLYQTWVARNDAMAYSIVKMAEMNRPIILIVGGGHVEHNMGIYERVQFLNSKLSQLNLGFKEVHIEQTKVEDYFETPIIDNYKYLPNYEYYWFTNRKDNKDPCADFNFKLE
jgi:uncharacterized iron-regulated protein